MMLGPASFGTVVRKCTVEVACGEEDAHLVAASKQRKGRDPSLPISSRACLPETHLLPTRTHLLVFPRLPTVPQTSFSANEPLGLTHPNHRACGSTLGASDSTYVPTPEEIRLQQSRFSPSADFSAKN